jgi:WD40 repeat protein
VEALAFSPDSRLLASGGGNYERPGNAIRLWDLGNSWNGIPALQHDEDVGGIAFNSNDGTLATASGKQVRIWDPARPGAPTLRFGDRHVGLLAFSPDGSTLAAEQAYEVSLWIPAQSTEKPAAVLDHDNQIHSLAFSPDGRFLATGTSGTVLETASERREVERHMERLQDVSTIRARLQRWFRQARDVELTDAQLDRLVKKELEKEKSEIQREIDRGQDEVWFWRLSPDSRPDRPPARPVTAVRGHRHNIDALAYSPDGRILVSGSVDRSMRLWDVTKALNPVEEAVEEPGYVVTAVAVSRDSRVLAAAIDAHVSASPQANAVKLWDLDTTSGESTILMERAVFLGHEQGVTSVAINPDSDRIASGSKDGTARIWDLNVPGGNPVIAPTTGEKITSVAFSPDGETLAIAEGRSVLLWPQRIQVLIDMACQRAGRNLTRSEWKQYLGDSPYRATCPQWPVEEDAKK